MKAIRETNIVDHVMIGGPIKFDAKGQNNGIISAVVQNRNRRRLSCCRRRQRPWRQCCRCRAGKDGLDRRGVVSVWRACWAGYPMNLAIVLNVVIQGVLTGLVYGLMALGLSVIFGVVRVVNFAHGEFAVVAMYATYLLFRDAGS